MKEYGYTEHPNDSMLTDEICAKLDKIGEDVFCLSTLETRNNDDLDFRSIPVWEMREALKLAYLEGVKDTMIKDNNALKEVFDKLGW